LCAQRGCKFSIPLCSDALFEHCRTVHGWRDYPCTRDNCQFVAYSKASLNRHHAQFHAPYATHNGQYFSCPRPNCKAAFVYNSLLVHHERIHVNDVLRCLFCPYVSAEQMSLSRHQRIHFDSRDYVCDVCQKAFTTVTTMNRHVDSIHEGGTTQCPLCDRVDKRQRIHQHLIDKHKVKGSRWDGKQKKFSVPQQIQEHNKT